MKAIKAFAFTKGAKKIFGIFFLMFPGIFAQQANAQFAAVTTGLTASTSSTAALTINGVYIGRGASGAGGNVALGTALTSLSTGTNNCALGNGALPAITSGGDNVAAGTSSGEHVTTGLSNILIGGGAGRSITTGNSNIVIGNLTDGNPAVGPYAGANISTGSYNLVIGRGADVPSGTLSNQMSIGNVIYGTDMGATNTGKIGIGLSSPGAKLHIDGNLKINTVPYDNSGNSLGRFLYRASSDNEVREQDLSSILSSNFCTSSSWIPRSYSTGGTTCSQISDNLTTVQIGTGLVGTKSWTRPPAGQTYGQYGSSGTSYPGSTSDGIITPPVNYTLYVGGWTAATGYVALSDKRLKKDIKKIEDPINKISKLNGYTYNWDKNNSLGKKLEDGRQAGFLAQEVEVVIPEAVVKNEDGIYGVNYDAIMPLLTEGINEQQKTINQLKLEIEELKEKLNQRTNIGAQLTNTIEYFQIIPNPVEQQSKIVYKLGNVNSKAQFIVYDLQGKMLKQIDMPKNVKEGQLPLNKSDLGKGIYILSLIINNDEVQSKKFLVL